MHELSIATNIVEIADQYVTKNGASKVLEIELEVGTLSGVVLDALEFAADAAFKDTILENAKRVIHQIEAKARCENCGHEFKVDNHFTPCPKCASFQSQLLEGTELRVVSLLVD